MPRMFPRSDLLRFTALGMGCLVQLLWGSVISYPLYANSLKIQFNFTERTVAFFPVFTTLGRSLTPLPVAVLYLFGPVTSYLIGLVLSSGGFFLLWNAMFHKQFHFQHPELLSLYFFLHGHGSLYSYLTALPILVKHFSASHEGKIISILEAFYAGAPLLMLTVYSQIFASDDPISGDDDVAGFFLFRTVSLTLCSFLCLIFIRDPPYSAPNDGDFPEVSSTKKYRSTSSEESSKNDTTPLLQEKGNKSNCNAFCGWLLSLPKVILSAIHWPILLVMASFCMAYPVCYGVEINMAAITKSLGYDSYFNVLYITFNLGVIVSRLAVGVLLDTLTESVPRTLYNAAISFLVTATLIANWIQPSGFVLLMTLILMVGAYAGIVKCLTLAVLSRVMGVERLAKTFGVCLLISPVLLASWQWTMTYFYQAAILPGDGQDCRGESCFRWAYLLSACLAALGTAFSLCVAIFRKY